MDLNSIINLAQLVAPQFVPALGAVNPLLPVAINVLGDALGAIAPHTVDSVSAAASSKAADEVAIAIKTASEAYAKHVTGAATSIGVTVGDQTPVLMAMAPAAPSVAATAPSTPTVVIPGAVITSASTGGMYIDRVSSGAMQFALAVGSALVGSGFLDPNGPLSGLMHAYPIAGAGLAIVSWFIHDRMVKASNAATAATEPAK